MKTALIAAGALALLAGCATVRYADGQRVAIEHDNYSGEVHRTELQAAADRACLSSGGKAPAKLVSNIPVSSAGPAALMRHTATFTCAQ